IGSIRYQTTVIDPCPVGKNCRQSMLGRQFDYQVTMPRYGCTARDNQPPILRAHYLVDPGFDPTLVRHADRENVDTQCGGDRLNHRELTDPGRNPGVPNDARPDNGRCDLLEHFQPLAAQAVVKLSEPCDVAAGMREALD